MSDKLMVAKKDTILCKRCNGDGDVPGRSDELERVSCPVCDGQPHIDYGMVAEYARQIDFYVGECTKARATLLQIARLSTGWKYGNEGVHLLNINKLAARASDVSNGPLPVNPPTLEPL